MGAIRFGSNQTSKRSHKANHLMVSLHGRMAIMLLQRYHKRLEQLRSFPRISLSLLLEVFFHVAGSSLPLVAPFQISL